ncbi:MAG: antitoxin [Beijerinckiaceae bacterium]
MTATAKLFMHGRSQAVRLPKEFRMPGTEVNVRREGDRIVLEPVISKPDIDAIFARMDRLGSADFFPDGLPDDPPVEADDTVKFD